MISRYWDLTPYYRFVLVVTVVSAEPRLTALVSLSWHLDLTHSRLTVACFATKTDASAYPLDFPGLT